MYVIDEGLSEVDLVGTEATRYTYLRMTASICNMWFHSCRVWLISCACICMTITYCERPREVDPGHSVERGEHVSVLGLQGCVCRSMDRYFRSDAHLCMGFSCWDTHSDPETDLSNITFRSVPIRVRILSSSLLSVEISYTHLTSCSTCSGNNSFRWSSIAILIRSRWPRIRIYISPEVSIGNL
jgi:hypothetical protein